MQGVQKLKCTSCGVMFMSETETGTTICPGCSESQSHGHEAENQSHGHEDMGGCGCGHSH